jgi:hypothetical protein
MGINGRKEEEEGIKSKLKLWVIVVVRIESL